MIEIGRLNKTFGIKGYIKVVPQKQFKEDLLQSDVWFIEIGRDKVPFFVQKIENEPHLMVKFEDVDSPEEAKKITGSNIYLRDKDIAVQPTKNEDDLLKMVGFEIIQEENSLGIIGSIEEYPQQIMAMVSSKDGDFLMPITPEFIIDIDVSNKALYVNLPQGFIESQT